MANIHPSAVVSGKASIAEDVEIGPFAVVEDDVELGSGSVLEAHSVLRNGARIGKSVTVGNFAVVAGLPQDLSFDVQRATYARIGDRTVLREGVTVNRSTAEGGETTVGEDCFLMATCHVGHDCHVGNRVVMANSVLLAGHVSVGDFCFLGGSCAIHQFCRIGEGVMVGGLSAIRSDVAPYTMASESNLLFGLNIVGLRRRGVSRETIASLQKCYRRVFLGTGKTRELAAEALEEDWGEQEEVRRFLSFFPEGKRGFVKPSNAS